MPDIVTWARCDRTEADTIHIAYSHPTNQKRHVTSTFKIPAALRDAEVSNLCVALEEFIIGLSVPSAGIAVYIFNRLTGFLRTENAAIPSINSEQWQYFVFEFFDFFMLRSPAYKLSRSSKAHLWAVARRYLKKLQTKGVIPLTTQIPTSKPNKNSLGLVNGTPPISSAGKKKSPIPATVDELFPKKFLVSNDANLSNDEFLDTFYERSLAANDALIDGCSEYWKNLKACHNLGKEMISKVSKSQLAEILDAEITFTFKEHPANPINPEGINWFLAAANHYLTTSEKVVNASFADLQQFPFFKCLLSNGTNASYVQQTLIGIVRPFMKSLPSRSEAFTRLLGLLNARDCAAACAILIKENPKFTSEGLQKSYLLNVNDKPYLFSDGDYSLHIFGIEKPRASARKVSILPPLSKLILEDVIKCTEIPRSKLKAAGDSNYRKLFILSSYRGYSSSKAISTAISRRRDHTLYAEIKSHLDIAGVQKSQLSLRNIRATQGLICFLKTGSFYSTAIILGNTAIVVQRHYISSWLAERWACKVARVFAQKVIVVATDGKPWQMQASDFQTPESLLKFIASVITEAQSKEDALSYLLSKMSGGQVPLTKQVFDPLARRGLQIKLAPKSLGALYYYVDSLTTNPPHEGIIDPDTGLTSEGLVDLKNLVNFAVADPEFNNHAEWGVRSHLQGKSHLQLKTIHEQALQVAKDIQVVARSASARSQPFSE